LDRPRLGEIIAHQKLLTSITKRPVGSFTEAEQDVWVGGLARSEGAELVASQEVQEIAKTFFQKLYPNAPAWKNWDDSDSAIGVLTRVLDSFENEKLD